jgi:hypothetical protein
MRIVWVLTVLRIIGAGSGVDRARGSVPPDPRYEQITIGLYESKSACNRMRDQVSNAPGFKAGSAQCRKEAN